eukprot:TRINITY_DN987_c0_g1_i3.p1 TRINITY_DN987_c0_g1~~TRINITY_DN987_c0_g1_i3.p1  ORF type:complete len:422 (+),score=109.32 TRINITY_DN987_c0_g1_i3:115-1266(+)
MCIRDRYDSMVEVTRIERDFQSIGEHYRRFMKTDYRERITKLRAAIDKNYAFLKEIIREHLGIFAVKGPGEQIKLPFKIPPKDISKMRTTLKQFVRDWSAKGKAERDMCYKPIIDTLIQHFPDAKVNGERTRVLVPGCGLGRLVFDLACKGFAAQGNEFSYFMLLGSNFILNVVERAEAFEIQPFIHNFSNNFETNDPFEPHLIPDVNLKTLIPEDSDFSMVAGEFVEVYKAQLNTWDAIATCFFIDTANNIIQYIETIYNILKPGGVWVNFGPLLYHYAELTNECSIELSWEELRHVILQFGFEIKSEEVRQSTYIAEKRTMMSVMYNCIFFVAIKPTNPQTPVSSEKEVASPDKAKPTTDKGGAAAPKPGGGKSKKSPSKK